MKRGDLILKQYEAIKETVKAEVIYKEYHSDLGSATCFMTIACILLQFVKGEN